VTTSTFVQATLQEWIETGNSCFDFHEVLGLLKMDNKVSKAGKTDPELTDEGTIFNLNSNNALHGK